MATGVDGADVLEAEVPLQVRLHKGRHKATAGSIHVNLHIVALHAFHMLDSMHWGHLNACMSIAEPQCHLPACYLLNCACWHHLHACKQSRNMCQHHLPVYVMFGYLLDAVHRTAQQGAAGMHAVLMQLVVEQSSRKLQPTNGFLC